MSPANPESLSAFLDGEVSAQQLGGMVDAIADDDALRQRLARYHLIGDSLRGERVSPQTLNIAAAVRARIQDEPTILAPAAVPRPARSVWLRSAAGVAIAASVATLALMVTPGLQQQPDVADQQLAAGPVVPPRPAAQPSFVARTDAQLPARPGVMPEARINRYLVDHNEYATNGGLSGFMPYASFVSYDGGR